MSRIGTQGLGTGPHKLNFIGNVELTFLFHFYVAISYLIAYWSMTLDDIIPQSFIVSLFYATYARCSSQLTYTYTIRDQFAKTILSIL